ncbi:hypothetical protein Tco_1544919 [Tanacetum coccineum]
MIERYVYGLAPQIRGMMPAIEPKSMQKVMQISGALTDEAVRNGTIKKVKKRGSVGEPSKDRNGRDDNKRIRIVNAFPLVWPSITEEGVTRLKEYVELTPAEAIQADCDIKAINIILQSMLL